MDGLASAIDTCVAARGGASSNNGDDGRGGCGRGSSSTSRLPLLASRGSGACRRRLRSDEGTLACRLSSPPAAELSPLRRGDIPCGVERSSDGDAVADGASPPGGARGTTRKNGVMLLPPDCGAGSFVRSKEAALAADAAAAACMATHEDVRSEAGSSWLVIEGACSTASVSVRLPPFGPTSPSPAPGMRGRGRGDARPPPLTSSSCTRAGPSRCWWASTPSGRERRGPPPPRPSGSPTSSSRNKVGGSACVRVGGRSTHDGRPPARPLFSADTDA